MLLFMHKKERERGNEKKVTLYEQKNIIYHQQQSVGQPAKES